MSKFMPFSIRSFAPQGMFGKVRRQFWLLELGWGGRLLLDSGGWPMEAGCPPVESDVAPEWRNGVEVENP